MKRKKMEMALFPLDEKKKMEMALFPLLEADCPDGRLVLIAVVRCLVLPVVKPGVPVLAGRWGLTVEI